MNAHQPIQTAFSEMALAANRRATLTTNTPARIAQEQHMETKPQSRQLEEKFVVRLPDGMRERIADEAKARHRSMNSEIIHRLGATFESDEEIARLYAIIDALIAGKPELAVGLVAIAQGA